MFRPAPPRDRRELPARFHIGEIHVDLDAARAYRGGERVELEPKAFDLLLLLAANARRLVEKEEIFARLWPDVVVGDNALTRVVSQLRRALGDEADSPRYLETVRTRGYRWLVEPGPTAGEGRTPGGRPRRRIALVAAAAAAAAALLAVTLARDAGPRGGAPEAAASPPAPAAAPPSLAILPFRELAAAADATPLGLGMADTLITKLSNVAGLAVRPTSTVLAFAGATDALAAGRALAVDHVLEGSVQRADGRLRVSVRLLRVRDALPLWAALLEEEATDLFALQDRISERVLAELAVRLSSAESRRVARRPTADLAAYEEYLRGRYLFEQRTPQTLRRAVAAFERAVELDPGFALAHAGIVHALTPLLGDVATVDNPEIDRLTAAARRALELDASLAEAHTAVAVERGFRWDWAGEERAYRRAIALNPNYPTAYLWLGYLLDSFGRSAESVELRRRAWQLDPTGLTVNAALGDSLLFAGRGGEAIAHLERTLELAPEFAHTLTSLGAAYVAAGEARRAAALFERAGDRVSLACALARAGAPEPARRVSDELVRQAAREYVSPYDLAALHAALGEREAAYARLEEAFRLRVYRLSRLRIDWRFAPLRGEPRFAHLARRVGLAG